MHTLHFQNVETCDYELDRTCINMCRGSALPEICDICNRQRPLLFIDMDEIIAMDGRVMVATLESIVTRRLSMSGP